MRRARPGRRNQRQPTAVPSNQVERRDVRQPRVARPDAAFTAPPPAIDTRIRGCVIPSAPLPCNRRACDARTMALGGTHSEARHDPPRKRTVCGERRTLRVPHSMELPVRASDCSRSVSTRARIAGVRRTCHVCLTGPHGVGRDPSLSHVPAAVGASSPLDAPLFSRPRGGGCAARRTEVRRATRSMRRRSTKRSCARQADEAAISDACGHRRERYRRRCAPETRAPAHPRADAGPGSLPDGGCRATCR